MTVNGGCYFLWAFGCLLSFPAGFWMVAVIVPVEHIARAQPQER